MRYVPRTAVPRTAVPRTLFKAAGDRCPNSNVAIGTIGTVMLRRHAAATQRSYTSDSLEGHIGPSADYEHLVPQMFVRPLTMSPCAP